MKKHEIPTIEVYAARIDQILEFKPDLSDWKEAVKEATGQRNALHAIATEQAEEIGRLQSELAKVYDAVGAEMVTCPKCGCKWTIPVDFFCDPRFDCPDCKASGKNK